MDALTAVRVGHIRSLSIELGKYADEHLEAGDEARGRPALRASEELAQYADSLEQPDVVFPVEAAVVVEEDRAGEAWDDAPRGD